MSIIVTVKQADTWNGGKTIVLKQFVLFGHNKINSEQSHNPIAAAKNWAIKNNHTNENEGDHIIIRDTQCPASSDDYLTLLSPEFLEENDFNLSWHTS